MDSKTLFKFAFISLVAYVSKPASNAILDYFNAGKTVGNSSEDNDSLNAAHKYVDLGLSVKWATCNIGASSINDFGSYFAWGDSESRDHYTLYTYKLYDGTSGEYIKYNDSDNLSVLQSEDDVATVQWGEPWRIPTKEEWQELQEKCHWSWETLDLDGNYGCKITAQNGNWIFLPAARSCDRFSDTRHNEGNYWSSTVNEGYKNLACCFEFNIVHHYMFTKSREYGCSVRPVLDTD